MNVSSSTPLIDFYQTRDGRSLAVRRWEPADAKANVVLLHGIISHGGWYESSCSHLATKGFRVHFLERRGSGLNADHRGDVDDWTTWQTDVVDYLQRLEEPRILLGISWGGILATSVARHHPELADGVGLICPGLFSTKAASPFQRFALRVAASVGLHRTRVAIPLKDPALFTNSPHHQRYVGQDPIALRHITIRFANRNLKLLEDAVAAPGEIRVPILLLLASDDPIAINDQTRKFVESTANDDKTVIEYSNASHTLEFEDDPSQYFDDLANWCQRIATGTN